MTATAADTAATPIPPPELKLRRAHRRPRVAADAERSQLSYLGFLAEILEAEIDARSERRRSPPHPRRPLPAHQTP